MHRVIALAALLILAACGGDADEESPPTVEQLRVIKVAGDQTAQVPPHDQLGAILPAGVRYAVVGADGYTDEPLIARIEAIAGGSASISGPSLTVVPAGTLVHWHIDEECGRLFAATTAPDDSAYTINRWAPGTVARTCQATAGRLVGDSIVLDATWNLVVLPGPVHNISLDTIGFAEEGDSIDIRMLILRASDRYGNAIAPASIRALEAMNNVWWVWPLEGESKHYRSSWITTVPSFEAYDSIRFTYEVFEGDGGPQWVAYRDGAPHSPMDFYLITYDIVVDPEQTMYGVKVDLWVRSSPYGWYVTANRLIHSSAAGLEIVTFNSNIADGPSFGLTVDDGGTITNASVSWLAPNGERIVKPFVAGPGGVSSSHYGQKYKAALEVQIRNALPARTGAYTARCENGVTPPTGFTCSEAH